MKRAVLLAGVAPLFLHVSPALAAKKPMAFQVGSCLSGVAMYPTITQALASTPSGSVINVCPGIYAEQLNITQSVTLQGVSDSMSSAPTIVPPPAGLVANYQPPTPMGQQQPPTPYAAQVAAIGAGTVKIANLTVDGTNNQISGCGPILVGILFESTSGTISGNQTINQSLQPQANLGGCQSGNAIVAESFDGTTYSVAVTNNQVIGFQKNGITTDGPNLGATITGNTVVGEGATPLIAQNGLQVGPGGGATVTSNVVSDLVYTGPTYGSTGILVYDAGAPAMTSNILSNTQGAIYYYADTAGVDGGPAISKNVVTTTHTFDGIDVCGTTNATITGNTVNGSDESAIHVDDECVGPSTGTTITANKINGACVGILEGPGTTKTTSQSGNTLLNTITQVQANSDSCTVTTPQIAARQGGHTQSARHPSPKQ